MASTNDTVLRSTISVKTSASPTATSRTRMSTGNTTLRTVNGMVAIATGKYICFSEESTIVDNLLTNLSELASSLPKIRIAQNMSTWIL